MKINLDLDYKLRDGDKDQFGDVEHLNREVSDFLIRTSIQARHPKMDTDKAKRYAKIQNALIQSEDTLEIDGTLLDFIIDAMDKAELAAAASSWKITLLEHLEEVKRPKLEVVES